jgi:CBS domain-containing protein
MVSYPEVAVTEVDWSAPIESVAHKQYAFCFEEDFATDALDTMRSQGATVLPVKNHSGEFSGIVTRTAAESRGTGLPG